MTVNAELTRLKRPATFFFMARTLFSYHDAQFNCRRVAAETPRHGPTRLGTAHHQAPPEPVSVQVPPAIG
jgi:hypothetical protein